VLHSLEDLLDSIVESLFRSIRYNLKHVLHQLLPPPKHTGYKLRSRGHSLTLSVIPSEFMRKKTSLTACYSVMIYINPIQTGLYFVYIVAYFVCLCCMPILWLSTLRMTKFLLKNFTITTTMGVRKTCKQKWPSRSPKVNGIADYDVVMHGNDVPIPEITTLWRYKNVCIIIIISFLHHNWQ